MASSFVEHYLPSGLRVVCEVMPRVSSAAIGFLVKTGSRHELSHQHGVSHYLEHMCFKGTRTRDWRAVNVRFDELGSMYNAFTGKEHTVYYGWVPAGRADEQLELLADMMRPRLAAEDYETERNVILEEIAMSADSFDHHVWNLLHQTVFGEHPLAHEILGEHADIANMPREVMLDYHRQRYAADNLVLFAAGAIEPERVFAGAGRWCGHWERMQKAEDRRQKAEGKRQNGARPNGTANRAGLSSARRRGADTPAVSHGHASAEPLSASPLPPLPRGSFKRRLEQFQQQSVVLLYPGVPHNHPDGETIEVFQSLFGGVNSRCYWNIVQKGVCSSAGAAWLSYNDCGLMALFADGDPEKAEDMAAALRQQAREVSEGGFTAEEVQRVKNRRRTHLALEGENPRTRLMQLVDDIESYDALRSADARLAAVDAVTPESIARYLREYPITGEGLLLSTGPRDWP